MKRLVSMVAVLGLFAGAALAHEGNEHVRGVVTSISAQSITVQTAKATRTFTLNDKTTYKQGGKAATPGDLKVGDRVVIDVPPKTTEARLIQIGTAATPAAAAKKKP